MRPETLGSWLASERYIVLKLGLYLFWQSLRRISRMSRLICEFSSTPKKDMPGSQYQKQYVTQFMDQNPINNQQRRSENKESRPAILKINYKKALHVQKQLKMQDPIQQFKQWFRSQPVVTRTYMAGAFIIACCLSLGFISAYSLFYTFNATVFELNLWRPLTALLFQGKFSFPFIFAMYFCYFGLSRVQTEIFTRQTYADFLWLCIYLYTGLLVFASIFPIYWIGDGFIFALMYIWCKRRPFETLQLFFGFKAKSGYFPWIYMAFQVLLGGSFYIYLMGLFLGHLYITIKDIFLLKYHKDYLPTPQFFKKLVYGRGQEAEGPQNRQRNAFAGRGVRIE